MKIKSVKLDKLAVRESQYPEGSKPEFLLVGRSNVGKSSFINTIINRKALARTSEKPGKTKTLNFFLINDEFYLVDAPGYGYAVASHEERRKFGLMIEKYINVRENLKRVFLLIDSSIKATENDLLMYKYLKYYNVPTTLIFMKTDKIPARKKEKQISELTKSFDILGDDNIILFSNKTKEGREEVLNLITELRGQDG